MSTIKDNTTLPQVPCNDDLSPGAKIIKPAS